MTAIEVDDVLNVDRLVTAEGAADIKIEKCYKSFFPHSPRFQRYISHLILTCKHELSLSRLRPLHLQQQLTPYNKYLAIKNFPLEKKEYHSVDPKNAPKN